MTDITVVVQIEGLIDWFDLEDEVNGYVMHADSFASKQQQLRTVEAEGDYVEGTYTLRAVRGNVVEDVVVIVSGATNYEFRTRLQTVTDALEQLTFGMRVTLGDAKETWTCFASDYTVETSQPFHVAKKGILRSRVKHLPAVTLEQV